MRRVIKIIKEINLAVLIVLAVMAVLFVSACDQLAEEPEEDPVQNIPEEKMEAEEEVIGDAGPECEANCIIKMADVSTSSGETFSYPPGKGSYTAAGALEWIILGNKFCENEEPAVQFKITKYYYGENVGEEVISIGREKESSILTHPNITDLKFSLRVNDFETKCS